MKLTALLLALTGCAAPQNIEKPLEFKDFKQENELPWLTDVKAGRDYQLDSAANPDILHENFDDFKIYQDGQGKYATFGSSVVRKLSDSSISVRVNDNNTSIHTRIIDLDNSGKFKKISSVTRIRDEGLVLRYEITDLPDRYSEIKWKAVWHNRSKEPKEDRTKILDESVEPYQSLIDLVKERGL